MIVYNKDEISLNQFRVKAKSSSIIYKTAANVSNVYLTNIGKAQYSYLDSIRTLAVKYQAKFLLIQLLDQQELCMQNN